MHCSSVCMRVISCLCTSLNQNQNFQNCSLYSYWPYISIFFEWYDIYFNCITVCLTGTYTLQVSTVLTNLYNLHLGISPFFTLPTPPESIKVHSLLDRYYCYFSFLQRRKYKERKGVILEGKEDGKKSLKLFVDN